MAGSDPKLALLHAIPIFKTCGALDLERIGGLVDEVDLPEGKILTRQGETGSQMFIIISGKALAERNGQQLAEFGPGSVIGEMALISEGPRTATVTVVEPMRALVVGHREFHSLMDQYPDFRMRVLEGLAHKVRLLEESAAH